MKRLTGFTIIELLVVMTITALLFGLGILAMTLFRRSVQLDQASAEFTSNIRSVQNLARNSILTTEQLAQLQGAGDFELKDIVGFGIFFEEGGSYSSRYCVAASSLFFGADCSGVIEFDMRSNEYNQVSFNPQNDSCKGIVFERLTGNISSMQSAFNALIDVGECTINVDHAVLGGGKQILIDLEKNNITVL